MSLSTIYGRYLGNLRADVYKELANATGSNDSDLESISQKLALPSSFTGGLRFIAKLYEDAMVI